MHGFELGSMIRQGWPVLSVLGVMSILSCAVLVDRFRTMRRAQLSVRAFTAKICRLVTDDSVPAAREYCKGFSQPVAMVAAAVLAQSGNREDRERALRHAVQAQIRELETYVPILGTIASSAPFVGLFGTVMGIIRAFADISRNVGGGPEVVASGIAEALVTTAGGLLVAIPALIGYNYFIRRIQRLADELDLAGYDLIETLAAVEDVPHERSR
jgi:biopolymer transport protein ExbB